jgi:predicted nuclease of predicted toxin-antitoxin system
MRVLFDQGVPAPLRDLLPGHEVQTAFELGWSTLTNGELLARAEGRFDALVTTDRNLQKQQNLAGRRLAILVLPTTSWPRLREMDVAIAAGLGALVPGQYLELP